MCAASQKRAQCCHKAIRHLPDSTCHKNYEIMFLGYAKDLSNSDSRESDLTDRYPSFWGDD